jgi:predicted O-methyltransferase YrrM
MKEQIIEAYSKLHSNQTVDYAGSKISFDGSQIMDEFITAWERIDTYYKDKKPKELTFLEVGAWRGLWGIAFCEYCKLNKINGNYTTITLIPHDTNNQHLYKTIEYLNESNIETQLVNCSTLEDYALSKVTEKHKSFNIVFIDAGHKYEEVRNDIRKFKPLAEDILLFHDIRPKEVNDSIGVYQAIQHSLIDLDEEIVTNENLMGIGIKYIQNA